MDDKELEFELTKAIVIEDNELIDKLLVANSSNSVTNHVLSLTIDFEQCDNFVKLLKHNKTINYSDTDGVQNLLRKILDSNKVDYFAAIFKHPNFDINYYVADVSIFEYALKHNKLNVLNYLIQQNSIPIKYEHCHYFPGSVKHSYKYAKVFKYSSSGKALDVSKTTVDLLDEYDFANTQQYAKLSYIFTDYSQDKSEDKINEIKKDLVRMQLYQKTDGVIAKINKLGKLSLADKVMLLGMGQCVGNDLLAFIQENFKDSKNKTGAFYFHSLAHNFIRTRYGFISEYIGNLLIKIDHVKNNLSYLDKYGREHSVTDIADMVLDENNRLFINKNGRYYIKGGIEITPYFSMQSTRQTTFMHEDKANSELNFKVEQKLIVRQYALDYKYKGICYPNYKTKQKSADMTPVLPYLRSAI